MVVVLALLFNFFLTVGVGGALFYYQTKETLDVNQKLNGGIINESSGLNTSGLQGNIKYYASICTWCVANNYVITGQKGQKGHLGPTGKFPLAMHAM